MPRCWIYAEKITLRPRLLSPLSSRPSFPCWNARPALRGWFERFNPKRKSPSRRPPPVKLPPRRSMVRPRVLLRQRKLWLRRLRPRKLSLSQPVKKPPRTIRHGLRQCLRRRHKLRVLQLPLQLRSRSLLRCRKLRQHRSLKSPNQPLNQHRAQPRWCLAEPRRHETSPVPRLGVPRLVETNPPARRLPEAMHPHVRPLVAQFRHLLVVRRVPRVARFPHLLVVL